MTKEEALKLALEALRMPSNYWNKTQFIKAQEAIKVCEETLAQPEQEPVAFVKGCNRGKWEIFPAKAHQTFGIEQPLYTTPPQRTWVGLTDEEISEFDIWHDNREEEVGWCNPSEIVAYIEAKLKEKNNA